MHSRLLALSLMLSLGVAACGGGSQPASTPASEPAATPSAPAASAVDPATAATVAGKISVEGALPANQPIRMNADPACVQANAGKTVTQETFVGEGGGLGNVFVYVQSGLTGTFPAPTTPVTMDQHGCHYVPHVFGVQVGQPIDIVNSDATAHNVSATAQANQGFNMGQPIQGQKNTKVFTSPEVMVHFKCNVHNWMAAYVGVLSHPYFAVTTGGGAFELKNLPAGTYTIEAWHEKLGAQTQSVTLAEKETKTIAFAFKVS